MKLYTEQEVKKAMFIYHNGLSIDYVMSKLTSIELPSDEEIEGACNEELNGLLSTFGFRKGAKWVIEQIKQQDNDRTI